LQFFFFRFRFNCTTSHFLLESLQSTHLRIILQIPSIHIPQHFYSLTPSALQSFYDLSKERRSVAEIVQSSFPEFPFIRAFWRNNKSNTIQTHRQFFDSLFSLFSLRSFEDWYSISSNEIEEMGGSSVLKYYHFSLVYALPSIYPNHDWKCWNFLSLPPLFWNVIENQRGYLEELGEKLNFEVLENWYQVAPCHLTKSFLRIMQVSASEAVLSVFPEINWEFGRFWILPQAYWSCTLHHRKFVFYLFYRLDYATAGELYSLSRNDFIPRRANQLLKFYDNDIAMFLMFVLPEFEWHFWLFDVEKVDSFWKNEINQKMFIEWLASQLDIVKMDQWYSLKPYHLLHNSGMEILRLYNTIPGEILAALYPQHF